MIDSRVTCTYGGRGLTCRANVMTRHAFFVSLPADFGRNEIGGDERDR